MSNLRKHKKTTIAAMVVFFPLFLSNGTAIAYEVVMSNTAVEVNAKQSSVALATGDQAAPAPPVISGSPISTNSATPTIRGTSEANATVKLYMAQLLIGQTTASGSGLWSIVTSSIPTGTYVISAKAIDASGNVSVSSATASLIVDLTASAAPKGATSSAPVVQASVVSVQLSSNGTMAISMKVSGAKKGQRATLYTANQKVGTSKVTKKGKVSFTGVASNSGAYVVVLTKSGKTVSRTQLVQIQVPRS